MESILIEELELGVRSYNCLKRAGIQTVGELVSKSEAELKRSPTSASKSIDEVDRNLLRGLRASDSPACPAEDDVELTTAAAATLTLLTTCATRRHETSSAATPRTARRC